MPKEKVHGLQRCSGTHCAPMIALARMGKAQKMQTAKLDEEASRMLACRSNTRSSGPVAAPRKRVEAITITSVADSMAGMPSSDSPSICGRFSARPYATAPRSPTAHTIHCARAQMASGMNLAISFRHNTIVSGCRTTHLCSTAGGGGDVQVIFRLAKVSGTRSPLRACNGLHEKG